MPRKFLWADAGVGSVAVDWGLEMSKTVHSLNLEESQLHFLLQLSLTVGTLEAKSARRHLVQHLRFTHEETEV